MRTLFTFIVATAIILSFGFSTYYPIDGYKKTGIARLYQLQKMMEDSVDNRRIPQGAFKNVADITLNLLSRKDDSISLLLQEDATFAKEINRLFPGSGYSATVLDMSNPDSLKYAAYRENSGYQPGSVGKIAVLNALFTQLAKLCPDSWEARTALLKNKRVHARYWGTGDHHTIPIYDIESEKLTRRRVQSGDEFSLYEWADHMVSVSNNGAASVVWREALLMAAFGEQYEKLTEEEAETYFKDTPRDSLTNLANDVVNLPLRELGITHDEWRLGSFFTGAANKYVGDKGGSIGTPVGLMKFLVQLEQGKVVDEKSSLEMKRLLYLTDRRIRYAKSPELDDASVYFKSGSFYKCDRNKDPNCAAYAGNVYNYMNSVIIVEQPDGTKYIVCLMSNVLNKNSAGAHMYLGSKIDKVIRS
ncbi:serine hydrolase [Aquimarina sp. ERC-38]|uniref:serine hydrolase n=1 Tax=Aquimarina sp. ERC-38 TaxID=2949996 RepID=UPI002246AAAB|nr:serine hydrolase [Aquimarina sp. ERC-38]UZO80266.1 serine hydrolase [Aquimarina sp. ERC-38]